MHKLASHLQIELTDNSFLMPLSTYQSTLRTMQALLVPAYIVPAPCIDLPPLLVPAPFRPPSDMTSHRIPVS